MAVGELRIRGRCQGHHFGSHVRVCLCSNAFRKIGINRKNWSESDIKELRTATEAARCHLVSLKAELFVNEDYSPMAPVIIMDAAEVCISRMLRV